MDDFDMVELLKEAAVKETVTDVAKRVADWIRTHPHEIAGGAIGGGLAGLGGYLASRPSKKTGRSIDQGKSSKLKKPGKDEGFAGGMARIVSNTRQHVADLAAKHPISMGLASVPTGVAAGRYIATKLKEGAAKEDKKTLKHARKWGRTGALIGAAPRLVQTAAILAHPSGRKVLARHGLKTSDVLKQGLGEAAVHGTLGYTAGRAAHRFAYGPAKEKKMLKKTAAELFDMADEWGRELARNQHEESEKLYKATEKVAAGVIPAPSLDTAKQVGRSLLAGATKTIRKHPVKSALGALAVGRYVMPKKDE